MSQLPVEVGDVLAGKYRVDRVLGVGGMGVVVAAHHLQLDERVALKFLLEDTAARADLVARFVREARASAKIRNDHVARVTDVGLFDSGVPYMVMEYLEGSDLETLIEQGPALSVAEAVDLVLQACEAIAEAHSLGIIHRDIKPANLFVIRQSDGAPFVKVLDFGISKVIAADGEETSLTGSGLLGSPLYMSPEQLRHSQSVDARADIWAVGVVLYELLAKRPPFEAKSFPELTAKITSGPHPPITSIRPDISAVLAAVIDRTLAKRPEDRFASIAELARALLPFGLAESGPSVRRIEATANVASPAESRRDSSRRLLPIETEKTVVAGAVSNDGAPSEPSVPRAPSAPSMPSAPSVPSAPRAPAEPRAPRRVGRAVGGGLGLVVVAVGVTVAAWSWSRQAASKHEPHPTAVQPQPSSDGDGLPSAASAVATDAPSIAAVSTVIVAPAPPVKGTLPRVVANAPNATSVPSHKLPSTSPTANATAAPTHATPAPATDNPFDSRK